MTNPTDADARHAVLADVIRERRTAKLLRDRAAASAETDAALSAEHRDALDAMIALAGTAPFHKRANEERHRGGPLASIVPWRFHVLERPACRRLVAELERRAAHESAGKVDGDDGRAAAASGAEPTWSRAWGSKIPDMLAAAGALVQVTWLPDPPVEGTGAISDNDVEHVAAAAAATQNLLLAAESHGWYAYWSSGGVLRDPALFEFLGIGGEQRLLGAIFLAPPDTAFDREIAGGLRDQRGEVSDWSRRVTLD